MTRVAAGPGPLTRRSEHRVAAGVCVGIATYLGVSVLLVRAAFVVLVAVSGLGIALYAVFWMFLPDQDGRALRDDTRGQAQLLGVLLLLAVTLAILIPLGLLPISGTTGPLLASVAGVTLVWMQADVAQRARWRASAFGSPAAVLRLVLGAVLLLGGLIGFLASRGQLQVARAGLLSTVVVVAGLVLMSSPWWFAMAHDLSEERRERIRSEERADVAAHLHDSVLQTLALIQKAAAEPSEVNRLARSQERELRNWLYASRLAEGTLGAALEEVAAQVEHSHGVPVELVLVGDAALDERSSALVGATREAVVNAARHSGAASIDVYAEVDDATVTVFVRDRGCGFDLDTVSPDRHGISGSVVGRMARHGGSATIKSTPGEGTEVRLELPRE